MLFWFFFVAFLANRCAGLIRINEILPNPDDECRDCTEWIEIYTTTESNLTGWEVCDELSCRTITACNISNATKYIIVIASNGLNFTNFTNVCITSSSLSLNNKGDVISLKYANITIDKVGYNNTKEDATICRCSESITTCKPTPQSANACESENDLKIEIPAAIIQNNIFAVAINAINSSYYANCYDVKIEVKQNNTHCRITQHENLSGWVSSYYYLENINLTSHNFFINCSKEGTTTIKVRLRKCNSDDDAYKSDIFAVYSYPHKVDKENVVREQNKSTTVGKSMLQIQKITNAKFGSVAKMYVTIYRNNTRKYAVYAYITDGKRLVSEKTTVYAKTKYTNISLAIPIKLNECGKAGNYTAVIEGIGTKYEMPVYIEGKDCKLQSSWITEHTEQQSYIQSTNSIVKTTVVNRVAVDAFIQPTVEVYDAGVLEISLELNNTGRTKNLTVYSYVESNRKCISCFGSSKDANKITLRLKAGQTASVRLANIIKGATGKAKVYVVIKAGSRRKTITTDITIHNKALTNAFVTAYKSKQESINEQHLLWLTTALVVLALSIIFKKHT